VEPAELNKKYFSSDTRGYKIITQYYYKYYDLFQRTDFPQVKDFLNQIFLNISGIDFSKEIKNEEAYIIGSIKIQCRVQLDKSVKMKNVVAESRLMKDDKKEEPVTYKLHSAENNPAELLDTQEMFMHINFFKLQLKLREAALLNSLIDEKPRKEIAVEMQINFNTLDTHIRRLRIKMADYFKKLGYSSDFIDKFEK
jgi:FixJ family two-component response regulator